MEFFNKNVKDAAPPVAPELVEHQLHLDIKDDDLKHVKAIEPEEESIELEHAAKVGEVRFYS